MSTAIIVAGMGFGDETKGVTVASLVRTNKANLVVRYCGGGNTAHNVFSSDGKHHTFSQFGSGTFEGAKTLLSRYMLVNPVTILMEADHLTELGVPDVYRNLYIERDALVTTPFHVEVNRLIEDARSSQRHGSCGMGIGETMFDWLEHKDAALFVRDLENFEVMLSKLQVIRERLHTRARKVLEDEGLWNKNTEWRWKTSNSEATLIQALKTFPELRHKATFVGPEFLGKHLAQAPVVFEGAQGVLLDQDLGFHPYTTWTDTTFNNANKLLKDFPTGNVLRLGVLRSYMTRHGAGPFVTEDKELKHPEDHNEKGLYQQGFRQGHFDFVMARYASDCLGGVDEIAMSHLDRVTGPQKVCQSYGTGSVHLTRLAIPKGIEEQEKLTAYLSKAVPRYSSVSGEEEFLNLVESELKAPVTLCAYGPRTEDRKPRTKIQNVA